MQNQYYLNLENIINSNTTWALNKQLATKLSLTPTFAIQDFFSSISDDDVRFLIDTIDQQPLSPHNGAELFLMATMLAVGEGLETIENEAVDEQRFNSLLSLIYLESLARKGLIKLYRDNMTLGEDCDHLMLAEVTEAGRTFIDKMNDE